MKLYRFTASNNQKAMMKVNEVLGLDALLYETRSTNEGVEILAGMPDDMQIGREDYELSPNSLTSPSVIVENTLANNALIEQLQLQIKDMDENIQRLISHITVMQDQITKKKRKFMFLRNPFRFIMLLHKIKIVKKEIHNEQPAN
jgi:flagellar biosynthesis GTPase FlhF